MPPPYPPAPRATDSDTFISAQNGVVQIPNPYKWLEDTSSEAYQSFISAQNDHASAFVNAPDTGPQRLSLKRRLEELYSQPSLISIPILAGGYYYYRIAGQGNPYPRWFRCAESSFLQAAESRKIGDSDDLFYDEAEEQSAVICSAFSPSGRLWAYGSSIKGSEWSLIHVRDTVTKERREDEIIDTKFTAKTAWISWLGEEGFFYLHWPGRGLRGPQMRFHRVGEAQECDEVVWVDENDETTSFGVRASKDGEWVFLFVFKGSRSSKVYGAKVRFPAGRLELDFAIPIAEDFSSEWEYAGSTKSSIYFHSTGNNGEIFSLDKNSQVKSKLACGDSERTLKLAKALPSDKIVAVYSIDVHDEIHILSKSGTLLTQLTSSIFTVIGINPAAQPEDFFILESTFYSPPSLWRATSSSSTCEAIHLPMFPTPPSPFKTEQVFYPSTDSTLIPMFLTSSTTHDRTTTTPAVLYIYGAHGISVIPHFRPDFLAFLSSFRGVLAIANVRGGGEKGASWYAAGRRQNRQVLFNDVISAVRYLRQDLHIENVILMGESMGALNSAAVMIQQPSLLQGVICGVGPFDVLRRQRISGQVRGVDDLGDPDVPEDFDNIIKWAPLENLVEGEKYPPLLLQAGAEDDLVSPFNSAKMAAAMQWASKGGEVSLRVVEGAGHGGNNSAMVKAKMSIEKWAWVSKALAWEYFPEN